MKIPKNTCHATGYLILKPLASIVFLIFIIAILSSCRKCDSALIEDSILQITVIDSVTGKNVYSKTSPLLNKDSVRVVDKNGNNVFFILPELRTSDLPIEYYYAISIYFIGYDKEIVKKSYEQEQCTSIRVYLTSSRFLDYNICYKSESAKCGTNLSSLSMKSGGRDIAIEDRSYITLIEKVRL